MPDKQQADEPAFLPYGKQEISEADIRAVVEALSSRWLTTGPHVTEFEKAFARHCNAAEGVAVNSGTAALHCAMRAIGVRPGDEVIVPAITFAASANAAIYEGGVPVFADVEAETLLIDVASVGARISDKTRAIVAVDFAGQPADYDALRELAKARNVALIADACHAPGAAYKGRATGTLADISCFSFHPVKHLTTCEGGMATTQSAEIAAHMRRFRNHGIDTDFRMREQSGVHSYDIVELGYNYRLSDIQCALGIAQLSRLKAWVASRQEIAATYNLQLKDIAGVSPLTVHADRTHAYHLYVVKLDESIDRDLVYSRLRADGIGANVHYSPVYLHSVYQDRGYARGIAPIAEAVSKTILTLPLFPAMTASDVDRVVGSLQEAID